MDAADPEAARAAEQIAAWAGISNGKREMIAATLMAGRIASKELCLSNPHSYLMSYMREALRLADLLIKLSKENPPI